MKKLILLVGMSMCIYACTSVSKKKQQENIDLVKEYVAVVENMDFEAMEKYLADDYLGMGPSYGDSINKTDAVASWEYNVKNTYKKIHYSRSKFAAVTITEGDNKGDWVANWAELTITYKNEADSVTIWANSNYLIENGKIKRSFTFYNEADALRQLGYKIVPPDDTEKTLP